jgi:hypothetical protein
VAALVPPPPHTHTHTHTNTAPSPPRRPLCWTRCDEIAMTIPTSLAAITATSLGGIERLRKYQLLVNFGIPQHVCSQKSWRRGQWVRSLVAATAQQRWPFATVIPPAVLSRLTGSSSNTNPSLSRHRLFIQLLASFRFVVSPAGLGWDCFRTYEIILAGAVPIITRTNTAVSGKHHSAHQFHSNVNQHCCEKQAPRCQGRTETDSLRYRFVFILLVCFV